MHNLTQYQKEALNHSKHISLTANAGSGKTFVLARRYIAILLEENIPLNNIVAITFTEKAASELYKRIADEIETRVNEAKNNSQIRKLESLRRKLVSAKISTIHSFCTEILKEFPTEAGIDANFIPIDQRVSNELISSSIDEVIQNSIRNNDSLFKYVKRSIRLLGSSKILYSVLKQMISKRDDVEKLSETIYSKGESAAVNIFREKFEVYFNEIFSENIDEFYNSVIEINSRAKSIKPDSEIVSNVESLVLSQRTDNDIFNTIEVIKNLLTEILTKTGTVKAVGYISKKKREGIHDYIDFVEKFYSEFKVIDFSDDCQNSEVGLAKFGFDIMELWKPILNIYDQKKNQKGYLDFDDLLFLAEKLVQREDVKAYLINRYKYFMIDEYQDTNETQYNIFIPILDYLKRGNLFIVGDEKQSIYMFRGADIKIFNETRNAIKEANDESSLLKLPHSFRLSKELTLFTNQVFQRLFSNPKLMFNEVKYDELIYAKMEDTESEISFLISDGGENFDSEVKLVVNKILELVQNKKAEFKDIAILARRRKSFGELENELLKSEIPYQIYGGKGFYQRQEICDVYNYLSFLLNPQSDEALVAILRSPFFLVSDKTIFQISNMKSKSFFEKLWEYNELNKDLEEVVIQLSKDIENSKLKQLSVLIRDMLHESGYWAKVATLQNSKQIFANLDKLINTSISFMDKGSTTLYDFVAYLKEAINKTEDESQAVISGDDKNVKLMTIHAAKGLEFQVVFLIDTNSKSMDDRVKSKSVSIDKEFGILTKTLNVDYSETNITAPVVSVYNYISLKKNIAELKRLLYVAVTRAESYLFISATLKSKKTPINESFLSLFQQGLNVEEFIGSKNLSGFITTMNEGGNGFVNTEKEINIEISFVNEIEIEKRIVNYEIDKSKNVEFNIQIDSINDIEQNEIISASKISVYNQCPLKYNLVYDLGYTSLFYKEKEDIEMGDFNKEDDNLTSLLPANIQGNIIHKLLEEEVSKEKLDARVEDLVSINSGNYTKPELNRIKLNIVNMVEKYYSSDTYQKICKYKTYKNEYEIYIKQNDIYLYGIIDKIVVDDNTAYIIDYKTDSLKKYSAKEKLENYKYQLMFYAYLASKMNAKIENIICQLIFIEAPSEKAFIKVTKEMLAKFETQMIVGINSMRNSVYNKNKSHCKSCYFADEKNNCIVN